ncbi:MAG: hypothetical protein U5L96_16350 [Owenweeksia sp.]|nr:hypothetical protein [Owenweeksia sp.]
MERGLRTTETVPRVLAPADHHSKDLDGFEKGANEDLPKANGDK